MKNVIVRKTIKFVKNDLVISDCYSAASESEAQAIVSKWQVGKKYGGGWLGPEYILIAVDYAIEE